MNKLAVTLALITIAALNVLLVVAAAVPDSVISQQLIAVAVSIMDLSLVVSSVVALSKHWPLLLDQSADRTSR